MIYPYFSGTGIDRQFSEDLGIWDDLFKETCNLGRHLLGLFCKEEAAVNQCVMEHPDHLDPLLFCEMEEDILAADQ